MSVGDLMFRPGLLTGQRVLITGGGTGLGRVMADAFMSLGSDVFLCGRRGSVLDQTAAELHALHGGRATPIVCDIRKPDAIAAMLDRVWADGGPLTGLVNNAAGNFISRTEDLSPRAFDAVADTVFRGTFYVTQDCGKRWLAGGHPGSVLSIVTTWVHGGSPFVVPSAMSKAGVHTMTQSLAVEWGGRGIRLNAIAPGLFPTEGMTARLNPGDGANLSQDNPMGRDGRMNELGNLAVFLMAPGSEYVNGQTIAIDGAQYQATGGTAWPHFKHWDESRWTQARKRIESSNIADRLKRST